MKAPANKNNLYSIINIEAAHAAMRDLQNTKAGFMLWYYLAENQNNYTCALSSADFMKETGCKIKAYNAAVEALIELGYLVPQGSGNQYIFYEKKLMLSQDIDNKQSADTLENITYPLKAQDTCATKEHSLSFESTRNNTDNTINNTNITFSGFAANDAKEKDDRKEWLNNAKYGVDFINKDGKIIIIETGEIWDIPRC